ncbi:unnamed protein product [Bursaphelenchus okinawaensis]|uniref:ANK_REP_REGION domain-containing protein n=1 Tax=Bursaphelenchus okinawaensis TaxID=465554 RepID=A0A811KPJ1_9BILA|nr:unnamed protein product [Bursaphelenchus okinawaensis]CAG9109274.1 unnamed protein product [Bursaphelenchus okinawaensis]
MPLRSLNFPFLNRNNQQNNNNPNQSCSSNAMGGTESKGKSGKVGIDQMAGANDKNHKLYNLVDMHGGGEMIPWMRYAMNSGDFSLIDGYMETKVKDMMYNGGKGKLESVAELVKRRNKERNERLGAFSRKKGKGKSGPNILDDFNQEQNQGDLKKALKLLDGGKGGKGDAKYREVVWKLEERGSMGENLVGCCLMQGSIIHTKLAVYMLEHYPKLVNDVFISEDYYGLSPLHQAIVNEDPWMMCFLLRKGADINQRCYGALFCPEDQISSRTDSLEHEYVEINVSNSNYVGKMYFGEYPLAFAASTGQQDCYRILRACKADPNSQDTNGNTVLHMTVIHENLDMFRLAHTTGAKLQVLNKQKLTPLTLAAKLAKKRMFEQILQLESSVVWNYGDAASTAFPLAKIDTINQETGELNEDSALSLIVYGDSKEHLDLLDGLLEDVLESKWKAFGRRRWIESLIAFTIYYIFYFIAFMSRPFDDNRDLSPDNTTLPAVVDETGLLVRITNKFANFFSQWADNTWMSKDSCHLWQYRAYGIEGYVRMVCEFMVAIMVLAQLFLEIRDVRNIGRKRWWQVLKSFPAKILYKISLLFTLFVIPLRFMCGIDPNFLVLDNSFSLLAVLMTTVHFLFYCRAVKFVGPFVLMVYTIITRDMIRFFLIYFIFLLGFSQGFYVIFLACERETDVLYGPTTAKNRTNILDHPAESMLRLFITTIGEFTVFYRELNNCAAKEMAVLGKVLFLIFEMFVILMLELSLQPADRLMALLKYSRPIGTDKRRRAFVVNRKFNAMNETERILKEAMENEKRQEKKQLLKRRLKGFTKEKGERSSSSAGHFNLHQLTTLLAPTPMPGHSRHEV